MAVPVFYKKSAPDDFKKNYSLAKNKYENYMRAKAATDFLLGIGVTALGSILTYFKDELSTQDTLVLNYVVAILPIIGAALEKLYETRGNRYAQFIEQGKNIGYEEGYLYSLHPKYSKNKGSSENEGMEEVTASSRYSASYSSSVYSEQEEESISSISDESLKDKVYEEFVAIFNEENCCSRTINSFEDIEGIVEDNVENFLEKKLGVKVDISKAFEKIRTSDEYDFATKNDIANHIAKNIHGLYKDIKGFERAKLTESIVKTFAALSVFALGIAASVFNYLIKTDEPKSSYNDAVSGISLAIAIVPVAAAAFLFARTVWYKAFLCCNQTKIAECSGKPADGLRLAFKNLKREAFDSELIEKLPINVPGFSVV